MASDPVEEPRCLLRDTPEDRERTKAALKQFFDETPTDRWRVLDIQEFLFAALRGES